MKGKTYTNKVKLNFNGLVIRAYRQTYPSIGFMYIV